MKPKISIITLGVSDFMKSLLFYSQGLGFETHNFTDGDNHVLFRMSGTWLSLFPKEELAVDATVSPEGTGFSGITLAHNVGTLEEVDTVYNQAIGAGATAVKKPQKVSWGGYSGYFADPDGYLWEVAYNPYTDLT
ncbi:MAG: VOC family protein [Candidatus Roizmanbacteria bacterium]|nr:VOC family protein [Candidatus Roizmanbacteria bacterium]